MKNGCRVYKLMSLLIFMETLLSEWKQAITFTKTMLTIPYPNEFCKYGSADAKEKLFLSKTLKVLSSFLMTAALPCTYQFLTSDAAVQSRTEQQHPALTLWEQGRGLKRNKIRIWTKNQADRMLWTGGVGLVTQQQPPHFLSKSCASGGNIFPQ